MAHELSVKENGKVEFAYLEGTATPWHALGSIVPLNSSLDVWEKEAGFDWDVKEAPVQFLGASGEIISYNDKKVLFRSDNSFPLSTVSKKFKVVQPKDILYFFEDLIQMNGLVLDTAGVLFGGRQFWALAKLNEEIGVSKDDKTTPYVLLTTSVDGTLATTAKLITLRVVCANTMAIALSEKSNSIIKVSHRTDFDARQVKLEMGLITDSFAKYQETITRLADTEINKNYAKEFFFNLVKDPSRALDEQPRTVEGIVSDLMQKFTNGIGNSGKTAYDVLNAVTEYNTYNVSGRTFDSKFNNQFSGKNAQMSIEALRRLELAIA